MGISALDMLCYRNAQRGPHLYQADEGGRIKIMSTQKESHEDRQSHHDPHPKDQGGGASTHHEHSGDAGPGGPHEHGAHEHGHEGAADADSGEAAGRHSHEKGAHEAEHHTSKHNPA
jgi:hypothetical protein